MRLSEGIESTALLAVCGGDTVKLFDVNVESGDPCVLSYTPTQGSQVNCVKWNHTNLVIATAGDDMKISLWRKNGQRVGMLPHSTMDVGDIIDESISAISFSNKGSRYLCSGGSGRVVRIWDLQRKLCIKKLSGHNATITGVMYNFRDEHLASISLKGDLIVHNLASGSRAAELMDPNGQVLRVIDYSRFSRHVLVTAGDDGSVHLWDSTGHKPKVSWLKQHSAPTTGVCFSPSSDKIIASVGLDKKLYIFDSSNKKPIYCAPYNAPFSSLVFRDDGNILVAGTNSGLVMFYDVRGKPQAFDALRAYNSSVSVTSLCWQRSKPVIVNENNCSNEVALLGGTGEDSILMPDPLPSLNASIFSSATSQNLLSASTSGPISNATFTTETPIHTNKRTMGPLSRLQTTQANRNIKDDMDVFSPLVDVQPIMPSLDSWWDGQDEAKKHGLQNEKSSSLSSSIWRFPSSEASTEQHTPISDWRSSSASMQDDILSPPTVTPIAYSKSDLSFSPTPPNAWGGNALHDKLNNRRSLLSRMVPTTATSSISVGLQDTSMPSSFPTSDFPTNSNLVLTNLHASRAILEPPPVSVSPQPRKYSTYAERISTTSAFTDGTSSAITSPKLKKTGNETWEELKGLPSKQYQQSSSMGGRTLPSVDGGSSHIGESSFSFQLLQRILEDTLEPVQESFHKAVRNVHIEILRQFHMHEMKMMDLLDPILKKEDELSIQVQCLRSEIQQLRQLL